MAITVAINGFGRIGRLVYRHAYKDPAFNIVAINDITSPDILAHLLKYDSVHGRFPSAVKATDAGLEVDGKTVRIVAEKDPTKLPWKELGVDVVVESTGLFTKRDDAQKHIAAGAKVVLISAPATDPDATIVPGVNHTELDREKHRIISVASCTTNCLAPVAKVLHDNFGILRGYMVTIHAYTGDQNTVDTLHKDLHRARAAAVSAIPTSTGAAKAVGLVLPELKGKLDGTAIRIPTPNVSLVSLDVNLKKEGVTKEMINAAMKQAAEGELKGILAYNTEPLVSIDFNHDPHSSIFALNEAKVIDGNLVRILTWYDNEWGFSNRMADTAIAMSKVG